MACAPSEDSDQPGHSPSLVRAFASHMKKAWVLSYPLSVQWRLIILGRCPGWSKSSLDTQAILFVLSCCGSNYVVIFVFYLYYYNEYILLVTMTMRYDLRFPQYDCTVPHLIYLWGTILKGSIYIIEPQHDKTNNVAVRPAKTLISLGIRPSDQSLRCLHEESLGP